MEETELAGAGEGPTSPVRDHCLRPRAQVSRFSPFGHRGLRGPSDTRWDPASWERCREA